MANFCMKCGGALNPGVSFCVQCGSPVAAAPPGIPNVQPNQPPPVLNGPPVYGAPPPPAPAKSGSAVKFILIAFFVICGLGIAGVVGTYYFVKSKVKSGMAEFKEKSGVDIGAALESAAKSRPSSERHDGCLLLSKQEAEHILGISLARVEAGNSSEERCDYYAPASAAKASTDQVAEKIQELGKSSSSKAGDLKEVERLVKNLGAGMNDGSTPLMQITIYRGNAQVAITAMNLGTALSGVNPERVEGPWDDAALGPMNSMLSVRKGENGFTIDLRQIPDGRDKG